MNLDQIRELSPDLHPGLARRRFRELLRGGLPSNSLPGGSRGSETPLPAFDDEDRDLQYNWTQYQSWLTIALATSSKSRRVEALHQAIRIQDWFLLTPDPIEDVFCDGARCTNLLPLGQKSGTCVNCRVKKHRKNKKMAQG